MEILILCGIYLVELACYLLTLRTLFEVQRKSSIWMVAGLFLTVVIGVLPISMSGKNVLVTVSAVGAMFTVIEGSIIEKCVRLILAFLLLECIESIFVRPCEEFLEFIQNIYTININYFIIKCCTVLSVFMLSVVKRKFNYKKTHINSVIYFVVGMIAVSMIFCLTFLNQVIVHYNNNRYLLLCNILNFAILISIFLLVVFIIYIKKTHERMEQLLKTEQLLKESQVNYYKQILKKETDTRKYRHDMINHLIYVQDILSKNRFIDAQKYLSSILGGFKKIQNTYYVIGNEMVETIMNYFFGMLSTNVKIEIRGKCPIVFDMEDTDVCTIFSNLFQNAVEEIKDNNLINAVIIVEVRKGVQFVEFNMKNSLSFEIDNKFIDKNGLPRSHKKDKQNHGIGMLNMKRAIERNNGKFEWNQKDGYFCVNIILPIK